MQQTTESFDSVVANIFNVSGSVMMASELEDVHNSTVTYSSSTSTIPLTVVGIDSTGLAHKKVSLKINVHSGGSRIFLGGGHLPSGCVILFFAENCMKMKEFGPRGRVPGATPLDPPMVHFCLHFQCTNDELPSTFIHEERVQVDENVHLFPFGAMLVIGLKFEKCHSFGRFLVGRPLKGRATYLFRMVSVLLFVAC